MNKRLKEKDEEATIELNRKQEELRRLLQEKDQEYEVSRPFHCQLLQKHVFCYLCTHV